MKHAWILAAATAMAQTPPAEFETLTISISETAERWEGEIRLHDSSIAADLQRIAIRGANARLLEASVIGVDGAKRDVGKSEGRTIGGWHVWDAPAKPGELIRFVAEQPVSIDNWREIRASAPYPVKYGTLRLRMPSMTVITKAASAPRRPGPETWEWTLDGRAAGDSTVLAVTSRFRSWADYADWLRQRYPVKTEAQREPSIGAVLRAAEDSAGGEPWEAQARLAGTIEAMQLRPVRYAMGAKEETVDPSAMTAALVRVDVEGKALWIDAATMTPPKREWRGARALRLDGSWETLDFGAASTAARMMGELSADGTLTATMTLATAGGEAALHESAMKRRLRSASGDTGKSGWLMPAQSKTVIDETKFVDRISKKTDQPLALLALDSKLNAKGSYVEEIELKLPPNYGVTARRHLDEKSSIGTYKSSAVVEDGRLKIRRELTLEGLGADEKFWRTVVDDQKRAFAIERRGAVDREAVLRETMPYQEGRAGHSAYVAQEFDLAIELLKSATKRDDKDWYSWFYLGRSYMAVGKLDEAEAAFQKELAANPKDQYVWPQLGFVYMARKDWTRALDAFDKQLALVPNDAYTLQTRPFPLMRLKRWGEAENAAAAAIPSNPKLPTLPMIQLTARICQGKVESARAEMMALLEKFNMERAANMPAEYLVRCGKELTLAEQLIEKAIDLAEETREGSYSGRHLPSAFGFQMATGDFRRTRAAIWRQLGKTEAAEREEKEVLALLEDDEGAEWLPLAAGAARAPEHWIEGVPVYCFVISAADGSAQVVDSLAEHDPNGSEAAAIAKSLRFPQVTTEGALVQTANVLKLVRTASGGIEAFRARRHKGTDLLRTLARERFVAPR